MKKISIISIISLFISIVLLGCVKQAGFEDRDKNYVFTFEDIKDFEMDKYKVRPLKNGKEYFYTKSSTKLNGSSLMYSINRNDELGREIKLITSINLQPDTERAIQLFNSSKKAEIALYKTSVIDVKLGEYKANELLIVDSEDYFSVLMRKDNLYYSVQIDGLSINEEHIKDNLLKKIDFIMKNGLKF